MTLSLVLRWTLGTALAGLVVGALEGAGVPIAATLLLPGLAMGLAQRIAAPGRVPPIWTLFSGLAWVAGALLDTATGLRPEGLGLWVVPTATMAIWQLFLLNDPRRAWPWLPASVLAAFALQTAAQGACAVGCGWFAGRFGPGAATAWTYAAGFAAYGMVTGVVLPLLARPPRRADRAGAVER